MLAPSKRGWIERHADDTEMRRDLVYRLRLIEAERQKRVWQLLALTLAVVMVIGSLV